MKKHSKFYLALFLGIFALSVCSEAFAASGKYAYVDVAKIFDAYQKTKDNDRVLQESGRKKEEERDAIVHEIRQMKDEMTLLGDDARGDKQKEMEEKMRQLSDFDRDARKDLGEQRSGVVREIFKDIDDTVKRYGERKGYDLIFNERALLFQSDKLDITNEVLEELNKDYAKKRK